MCEEERFQQVLKQTYERWYAKRGIATDNTQGKIDFLRTQLCGKYRVEGSVSLQVELGLLEQAHFLEQV
jgi:hypothetical protein